MGTTFQYRDDRVLGLEDLRGVLGEAEQLREFRGFSSAQVHDGFFERESLEIQESLSALKSAPIDWAAVEGRLESGTALDDFKEVFRKGMKTVGAHGSLAVRVGFEERNSRQSSRTADTAGVLSLRGESHFSYGASGSKVRKDADYRREFMRGVCASSLLPLSFREEASGFRLEHSNGGDLWTSGGRLGGFSPSQFRVSTPGRTAVETVDLLEAFVESFGSGRRFEHAWRAQPLDDALPSEEVASGMGILQQVAASQFPAVSYWLHVVFRLAAIDDLEAIRTLCGPDDQVILTLCSLRMPTGEHVNVDVLTEAVGHRIRVESRLPLEDAALDGLLGLELIEAT